MAQPVIQSSFNSGEWAPSLHSRVDLEKYHSGAALLRNFYVDYRGGASTRVGTKYVIRAYDDSAAVRLIPFQASLTVAYILEFGDEYIRFHRAGAPILEATINITGASKADPCVITAANSYVDGDWVYITGVGGMTELNGKYFVVRNPTGAQFELEDLWGASVNSSAYTTYTSGGTAARIYTITSPYAAADLARLKFVQNVNTLILTHPDYEPRKLVYTSAASWALSQITFGTTVTAPTGLAAATTLGTGSGWYYSYKVTAVDGNGQESELSGEATLSDRQDIRTVAGSNTITWTAVTGAARYYVYRSDLRKSAAVPAGVPYGYIGDTTSTTFVDSNISPDFSQPPPTPANPFAIGSAVASVTITTPGSYTTAPTVTFGAPASGTTATGTPVLEANTISSIGAGGSGYSVSDTITLSDGVEVTVDTVSGGAVTAASISSRGSATTLPSNPVAQVSTSGSGTGATFNLTWRVLSITITEGGDGYSSAPTVTFSAGTAAGTAVLGPVAGGNPSVPAFFQQRLVLGASDDNPQTLYFSQPGLYYNYNVSNPSQDDDAITATIVSGQLNNIKALIPTPGGLIVITDGSSFLINGGSLGSAITPASITSNAQSFLGCNDMPPIVVNYDILYVQAKGSSVRDSSYNFYSNVFTGADVSIISSHLFLGYQLQEWCWAEEHYKIVWAVRSDGTLLSFTFIKEQEFQAWAHHDTEDGNASFKSVATIAELSNVDYENFVYTVVERTIGGNAVKYIEYFPERSISGLRADAWCVDSGINYSGSPETDFSGGEHLAGKTVTGLADGVVITPFTMPASGNFTLATAASKVVVGLAFTPQLQTLPIDTGDPTIQGKVKKIPGVTVAVVDTLGLEIGSSFDNLVAMKDLVVGNVSSTRTGLASQQVTDLVTGYAYQALDPTYNVPGQYCFQQSSPYPATILGVFPELSVGNTPK